MSRRGVAASIAVLLLASAAAAAILLGGRTTHRPRARGVNKSLAPLTPTSAAPLAWGLETGSQVTAVRRLAAYGLPLYCAGSSKPMVALTFDDGPGVYTHLALKLLREHHVTATFFLVGNEIRAWPGWAQREEPYAAFGDHTMTHPFLPALAHAAMFGEIARAQQLIGRTVREPIVLFRPPYEGRTRAIDAVARRLGLLEVLWTVDSRDSEGAEYAAVERNAIAGLRPGSIILMHENRGQTIRALPTILAALAHRHLHAVTVPQLVADDPPSLAQLRAGVGACAVGWHLRAGS